MDASILSGGSNNVGSIVPVTPTLESVEVAAKLACPGADAAENSLPTAHLSVNSEQEARSFGLSDRQPAVSRHACG